MTPYEDQSKNVKSRMHPRDRYTSTACRSSALVLRETPGERGRVEIRRVLAPGFRGSSDGEEVLLRHDQIHQGLEARDGPPPVAEEGSVVALDAQHRGGQEAE